MQFQSLRMLCWATVLGCLLLVPAQAATTIQALVGEDSPAQILQVDTQWLSQHLVNPGVLVVDARPTRDYLAGHIPGAVSVPVDDTFSINPPRYLVAPIRSIQTLFSQAGISNELNVVVYDSGALVDAGRMFWVLETYGHRRVALLDGGYGDWQQGDYPLETEVTKPVPRRFLAIVQPQYLATKLYTRLAINDAQKVIIDARSQEEFRGEKSSSQRFGHIPTAVNIPWERNLQQQDGVTRLRPLAELGELYAGLGKDKDMITYCNRGRQSALTYFVLRRLGMAVAHYDGSWLEWGNDKNLPVE